MFVLLITKSTRKILNFLSCSLDFCPVIFKNRHYFLWKFYRSTAAWIGKNLQRETPCMQKYTVLPNPTGNSCGREGTQTKRLSTATHTAGKLRTDILPWFLSKEGLQCQQLNSLQFSCLIWSLMSQIKQHEQSAYLVAEESIFPKTYAGIHLNENTERSPCLRWREKRKCFKSKHRTFVLWFKIHI